jgi:hypothetical protein
MFLRNGEGGEENFSARRASLPPSLPQIQIAATSFYNILLTSNFYTMASKAMSPEGGPYHISTEDRFTTSINRQFQVPSDMTVTSTLPVLRNSNNLSESLSPKKRDAPWPTTFETNYELSSDVVHHRPWSMDDYQEAFTKPTIAALIPSPVKGATYDSVVLGDPSLVDPHQYTTATHYAARTGSPSKDYIPSLSPKYVKDHPAIEIMQQAKLQETTSTVRTDGSIKMQEWLVPNKTVRIPSPTK